jgi:outer membrane receptor for ferrienterochelin and colicin
MKSTLCKFEIFLCCFLSSVALAEDKKTGDDIELIKELQSIKEAYGYVESASKIPQAEQQAPGVVTVISEEEILNSGARDLIDVLRLVPGFYFGSDVENTTGIGIRGNWAHEGKVVLLIDGLEMNERRFANLFLGQHYPIDHIQKIEVIRGPGSVMYGGFAKLGVINVVTKNANDQQGLSLVGRYGQMKRSNGHRSINYYVGKKLTDDMQFTVSGKVGEAHRSDRVYTDAYANSVDLAHTNTSNDILLNAGFQYKKLAMRFFMDDYNVKTSDRFVAIENPINRNFKTYIFDLKYQYDIANNLKLNFKFDYSNQLPWVTKKVIDNELRYTNAILTQRYLGGINFDYAFDNDFQIVAGIEYSYETFKNLAGQYDDLHSTNFYLQKLPTYQNISPFFESMIKSDWGNLTLGLRYDKHNMFQSNLAPRLIFTNQIGNFNYKLLYNNSFRIPTIENAVLSNNPIKPERTKTYEIELGYQLTKDLRLKANAFYLSSKNTIVYGLDPNNLNNPLGQGQQYYNANQKINTAGVESELRWQQEWGYLTLNYSYSQMLNNFKDFQPINQLNNQVADSKLALAFPAHKITFNSHIQLTPSLSLNPSLIFSTSRYGYDRYDENNNLLLHKYSSEVLANMYLRYQNFVFKDLELGLGVYNLFNANHNFIQPYNSGHAPLPDRSREIVFRVAYQLN